jgi:hypothetical protein
MRPIRAVDINRHAGADPDSSEEHIGRPNRHFSLTTGMCHRRYKAGLSGKIGLQGRAG